MTSPLLPVNGTVKQKIVPRRSSRKCRIQYQTSGTAGRGGLRASARSRAVIVSAVMNALVLVLFLPSADLVVLSSDPLTARREDLPNIQADVVILDGKIAYERPEKRTSH